MGFREEYSRDEEVVRGRVRLGRRTEEEGERWKGERRVLEGMEWRKGTGLGNGEDERGRERRLSSG